MPPSLPGVTPEPGRYQIYASYACPQAHRSLIVHELPGLREVAGGTNVNPSGIAPRGPEIGWTAPRRP